MQLVHSNLCQIPGSCLCVVKASSLRGPAESELHATCVEQRHCLPKPQVEVLGASLQPSPLHYGCPVHGLWLH